MKNQKSGTETGWHIKWGLPMPEYRALAGVIRRRRERRGWSLGELARNPAFPGRCWAGWRTIRKIPR